VVLGVVVVNLRSENRKKKQKEGEQKGGSDRASHPVSPAAARSPPAWERRGKGGKQERSGAA